MSSFSYLGVRWRHPIPYYLTAFFLSIAFLLAVLSFTHICTSACEAEHAYRLFTLRFETIGIPFFATLLSLHLLGWRNGSAIRLKEYLIASAVGAELVFVGIQKFQVGSFCPLCLSIAAAVFLSAISIAWEERWRRNEESKIARYEEEPMHYKYVSLFAAALVAFVISFAGITTDSAMEAMEQDVKQKLALGKSNSSVEIYIFTDWFCPPCRKLEPTLVQILPELMKKNRVSFIDVTVHPESLDFVPYNLSFLVNNKPQYLQLREVLGTLAKSDNKPSEEQVKAAAAKAGVSFKELDFTQVALGLDYFQEMTKQYNIDGTPIVLVVNHDNNKQRRLEGVGSITEEKIQKAIKEVE